MSRILFRASLKTARKIVENNFERESWGKVQQMTRDTALHLIRMQMRTTELLRIEEVQA